MFYRISPIRALRSFKVVCGHTLRPRSQRPLGELVRSDYDDLPAYVDALERIDVLCLYHPAVPAENERPGDRSFALKPEKVFVESKRLITDLYGVAGRINGLAAKRHLLKEGAIIAGGFETPTLQVHFQKLGRDIEPYGRRIASRHRVRRDEVKIVA